MPEPRSALVSTRRAEAAPSAAASRRSVNWIHWRSACAAGASSRPTVFVCSANARWAVRSPTMRSASERSSPTRTLPRQSSPARLRCSAYGSRKGAARRRSSRLGRQRIETSSSAATLASSEQTVPWVSGSQPDSPNSCCGRSQPIPNGPASTQPASSQPERASVGSSRV